MPVMIFSIPQVVNLTLPESSGSQGFIVSNYPMQRTDFRIIRNVQNEIEFFVKDIDRRAIALPNGSSLNLNIVDPVAYVAILTVPLTVQDSTRALFRATIPGTTTTNWTLGSLRYSVSLTRADGTVVMLWTDKDYSPNGTITVSDGPILTPALPVVLDPATFLPDGGLLGGQNDPTMTVSSALPGSARLAYPNGLHTLAVYLSAFTGIITIQGSLSDQPSSNGDWFTVLTTPFNQATGTQNLNVQGNFVFVRIIVGSVVSGSINQILYKN